MYYDGFAFAEEKGAAVHVNVFICTHVWLLRTGSWMYACVLLYVHAHNSRSSHHPGTWPRIRLHLCGHAYVSICVCMQIFTCRVNLTVYRIYASTCTYEELFPEYMCVDPRPCTCVLKYIYVHTHTHAQEEEKEAASKYTPGAKKQKHLHKHDSSYLAFKPKAKPRFRW